MSKQPKEPKAPKPAKTPAAVKPKAAKCVALDLGHGKCPCAVCVDLRGRTC